MMRRRRFIAIGVGSTAAVSVALLSPPGRSLLARLHGPDIPSDALLGKDAYTVVADLRGTNRLAHAWRALPGNDSLDGSALERMLVERLALNDAHAIAAAQFGERLRSTIVEDFRQERLCEASDWLVSETECLVAALRLEVFGESEPAAREQWREGRIVDVTDWGPRRTEQGVAVNVQPDGHAGLWFRAEDAPSWLQLEIDGTLAPTVVSEDVVTSGLYGPVKERILSTPGEYALVFVDEMNRIRQPAGVFVVTEPPPRIVHADGSRSAFCAIEDWGPRENRTGRPANPQGEADEGLWLKTPCAPPGAQVLFDGAPLRTTIDPAAGLVTALLPASHFAVAREARVQLHDTGSGEILDVGVFRVSD